MIEPSTPLLASQVLYQLSYLGIQFCLRYVPLHQRVKCLLKVLHTVYNEHIVKSFRLYIWTLTLTCTILTFQHGKEFDTNPS